MADLKPPADMSRAEKKAFRKLAQSVAEHGLDASSRGVLIESYVRQESRLEGLRQAEKQAENTSKMAATRALNVAMAESRRLHDALFKGGRRPVEVQPTQAERVSSAHNEADEAWRAHYRDANKLLHSRDPDDAKRRAGDAAYRREGDTLRQRYGDPSWHALLYRTLEEQVEGERYLEEQYRRRPTSFNRPPTAALRGEEGVSHHAD